MFESIEIRKAKNGFIVTVTTEDDAVDYVFDTVRKSMSFIKKFVDQKQDPTTAG